MRMHEYKILMMPKNNQTRLPSRLLQQISKVKHCFKINIRLLQQTSMASRLIQDQALPQKQSVSKTFKALVIDYQVM